VDLQRPDVFDGPLWSLPILGGSARRLGDTVGRDAAWSPDGRTLVYNHGRDLFLARGDGTESRKLVSLGGEPFDLEWSPDGSRLRFSVRGGSLWEVLARGTNLHRLLPGLHNPPNECCGRWTPDGKYFVFESPGEIWTVSEQGTFLRRATGGPVRLTATPIEIARPLPSKDGKKIFMVGRVYRGESVRYDLESGQVVPLLPGISGEHIDFSKDGDWMAYVTFPEHALWRSKRDGSLRRELTYPPLTALLPRWSPDGKQIVFVGFHKGEPYRIYTVSAQGGEPQPLLPGDPQPQSDPSWSPDGRMIAFGVSTPPAKPDGGGGRIPNHIIHVLNLESHLVSTLPGSQGLFSPRWSPDGRYILAMPVDFASLLLFDIETQQWSELANVPASWPLWSKDGHSVYFMDSKSGQAVFKVRISDREVRRVADLKGLRTTGYWATWMGLAPDDSPLFLRDIGSQDVYSLDWQEP